MERFAGVGLVRQAEHGVNVNGTELARAGLHFFHEQADHPLADGVRRLPGPKIVEAPGLRLGGRANQILQGDAPCIFIFSGVEEEAKLRRAIQPGVILSSEVGELAEMINDGGLELLLENRHELQAYASTCAFGVAIRGVLTPSLPARAKVGAQIGAAQSEQRAKNGAGFWVNAAQSGQASAAENVSQDSFGLVIGGVGNSDFVEPTLRDQAVEASVARATGCFFEVGTFALGLGGDVFAGNKKCQIVTSGERGDKFFICVRGPAAQLVIEMSDRQNHSEFFAEFEEQQEKRNRVCATRNRDADALAGAEHVLTLK